MEENPLNRFLNQAGRWLNIIGGTALTAMMVLTVADVILRAFGHPILGAYGHKAEEIDGWLAFVRERIEYWKGQEKSRKIPTTYQY